MRMLCAAAGVTALVGFFILDDEPSLPRNAQERELRNRGFDSIIYDGAAGENVTYAATFGTCSRIFTYNHATKIWSMGKVQDPTRKKLERMASTLGLASCFK